MRLPLPSGLSSTIAARSGGSPELTFESRSDRDVHLRPGLVEQHAARRMAARRQRRELLRLRVRGRLSRRVRKADHGAFVADVQPLAVKGEAVRVVEAAGEREALLGDAVVIRVAQDRDLPFARLGEDHVAVRREQHRPRIAELVGEERDVEPGRQRAASHWRAARRRMADCRPTASRTASAIDRCGSRDAAAADRSRRRRSPASVRKRASRRGRRAATMTKRRFMQEV